MANEVKIEGMDVIIDKLTRMNDPQEVRKSIGKACALVERSAKKKAPKGEGDLRRNIKSKLLSDISGVVFNPLEYAPYVEYGTGLFAEEGGRKDVPWVYQDEKGEWHSTSGQKPHPFMRPALNENREEIIRIIKEGLMK